MADYIDRSAAIEALRKFADDCPGSTEAATAAATAISVLSRVPGPWVEVKDGLPKAENEVLALCDRNGFQFVCPAIYEDGSVLAQDSMWNWNDLYNYGTYSEEDNDYYVPEGWWENRQFTPDDVYNNPIDCEVTRWMELPDAPEKINKEMEE